MLCAGPGLQGAIPFSSFSPTSPMTPWGFCLLQGSPLEHYPGRKPSRLNEQRLRSEAAAPVTAWLAALGHCGRTKLTHTTIPRQPPLSPFLFIIVIITFQTRQLLGLVISGEAFGQSVWGPLLPPRHPSPSQAQLHCCLFDKIHKTDTDRLTYMTSLNFNPFFLSRRGGPASVEVPKHCSPSKPS